MTKTQTTTKYMNNDKNDTHMRTETPTPAPAAVRLYKANLRVKDRPTYLRSLLRRTGRGPYLFPRALLAHLSEIDFYFPGSVSEADRQELNKLYANPAAYLRPELLTPQK